MSSEVQRERRRRRGQDRGRPKLGRAAGLSLALAGAAILLGPQLLGGVYGWAISALCLMSAGACLAAVWQLFDVGGGLRPRPPIFLIAIPFLFTLLQLLPLPVGLIEHLNPEAVAAARRSSALLGVDPPSWLALTLSPAGTRAEVVKGGAIVAIFLTSWILVSRGMRRTLLVLIGASTVLVAAVALAHLLAGADALWGVYAPVDGRAFLLGPLINENHLGGFCAMGVPLLVGLGLDAKEDLGQRVLFLVLAVVVGATAALSISRGAIASLAVGLAALGLLAIRKAFADRGKHGRRRGDSDDEGEGEGPRSRLLGALALIGAVFSVGVGVGLYVASDAIFGDFQRGDFSKLELAKKGLSLAIDYPYLGVGRGAFAAAFARRFGQEQRFVFPENVLVQWASEWGLVLTAILALGLLLALGRRVVRARRWAELGAMAALLSIAAHDLVDFSMEMAGVAVVASALLACVLAPNETERSSRARAEPPGGGLAGRLRELAGRLRQGWTRLGSVAAVLAGASVAVGLLFGPGIDRESTHGLQERMIDSIRSGDRIRFRRILESALEAHPAEPMVPLMAATEATRAGDNSALRWANRAMELAPGWAAPHVVAAQFLASSRRLGQAYLEIHEAERLDPGNAHDALCAILAAYPNTEPLIRASRGEVGTRTLASVEGCEGLPRPLYLEVDAALLERGHPDAIARTARRRADEGEAAEALRMLREALEAHPSHLGIREAFVDAYLAADRRADALRVLSDLERRGARPWAVLSRRARIEAQAGDAEAMRASIGRLRRYAAGSPRRLARLQLLLGDLERDMDNLGAAMVAYREASRLDPESPALARIGATAERAGDLRRAYSAYTEVCRQGGEESPRCADAERIRVRLESPTLDVQRMLRSP